MQGTILIVDDVEINRDILGSMLNDEYDLIFGENGLDAVREARNNRDILVAVLLDLVMPEMDGLAALKILNEESITDSIPVLIITGEQSVKSETKCFDLGAADFIRKPFDSTLVKRRVKNVVELYLYKKSLEQRVSEQTKRLDKQNKVLRQQTMQLRKNNERIIDILGTVVESRNFESGEHIKRVKAYTELLACEMMRKYPEYELTPSKIDLITEASALHDIGKIAIPDNILLKPGRLTDEEFEVMKEHTTRGCELLEQIKDVWEDTYDKICYSICRYHHERYDGRGYPDHLKGDEIPIEAQLVSLADVYDALVNIRCYKPAYSHEIAYEMIVSGQCGQFSPKLLVCFGVLKNRFADLRSSVI